MRRRGGSDVATIGHCASHGPIASVAAAAAAAVAVVLLLLLLSTAAMTAAVMGPAVTKVGSVTTMAATDPAAMDPVATRTVLVTAPDVTKMETAMVRDVMPGRPVCFCIIDWINI